MFFINSPVPISVSIPPGHIALHIMFCLEYVNYSPLIEVGASEEG